MLKLIARQTIPKKGYIDYPGNWRVRFVGSDTNFFNDSVWGNLTFGIQHFNKDGSPLHSREEITDLLEKMGLSKDWSEQHLADGPQGHMGYGGTKVNHAARAILNIARALLSSPQLLLIANAIDSLGAHAARKVVKVLRELVAKKGLPCLCTEYKAVPWKLKKPRTVIVSTRSPDIYSILFADGRDGDGLYLGGGINEVDVAECMRVDSPRASAGGIAI